MRSEPNQSKTLKPNTDKQEIATKSRRKKLILFIVIILLIFAYFNNQQKPTDTDQSGILSLTIDTKLNGCSTRPGIYLKEPNASIDWGDGSDRVIAQDGLNRHSYPSGEYQITVTGNFKQLGSGQQSEEIGDCFKSLDEWTIETGAISSSAAFSNAGNLLSVVQPPRSVTDYSSMFWNAGSFNFDIGNWDVSKVKDMSSMFYGATSFNQNIGGWDTSCVTTMEEMFNGAENFNQFIGGWRVGSVISMEQMFQMDSILPTANNFNQDIGSWDTSKVESMRGMFRGNRKFNQDLGRWNVESVKSMNIMFEDARAMDADLSGWNVNKVGDKHNNFRESNSLLVEPNWIKD